MPVVKIQTPKPKRNKKMGIDNSFHKIAKSVTDWSGTPWATLLAISFIIAWLAVGFVFGFTPQHQLSVNSVTTIVTFIMVFLLQHSQNVDSKKVHHKLNRLLGGESEEAGNHAVRGSSSRKSS